MMPFAESQNLNEKIWSQKRTVQALNFQRNIYHTITKITLTLIRAHVQLQSGRAILTTCIFPNPE